MYRSAELVARATRPRWRWSSGHLVLCHKASLLLGWWRERSKLPGIRWVGVHGWGWGAVAVFWGALTLSQIRWPHSGLWHCESSKFSEDLPEGAVSYLCLILAMCTLGLPSHFLSSPVSPSICSTQGLHSKVSLSGLSGISVMKKISPEDARPDIFVRNSFLPWSLAACPLFVERIIEMHGPVPTVPSLRG